MTRAGSFDREVSIESPVISKETTYGSAQTTWSLLTRCPAEVKDDLPSRNEEVRQGLSSSKNRTRIRIRWRPDITSSMRVTLHGGGDVVYQIIGGPAAVGGRQEMIEMMCERYMP